MHALLLLKKKVLWKFGGRSAPSPCYLGWCVLLRISYNNSSNVSTSCVFIDLIRFAHEKRIGIA